MIEEQNMEVFYVGNNGNFDFLATQALKELKNVYPHISYYVVLAYPPKIPFEHPTLYPEKVAQSPPKAAIDRRNRWMVDNSDRVVACVKYGFGGAVKYLRIAEKQGKTIYNLAAQ